MSLVANIAPPAVGVLICAIAYVSVRRAHRKISAAAPVTPAEAPSAAE